MSEPIELPENAREILDKILAAGEDELYKLLGESLETAEPLEPFLDDLSYYKSVATEGLNIIGDYPLSTRGSIERRVRVRRPTAIESRLERGKRFFEASRERLYQKICIEMNACKWEKDILNDSKELFSLLLPVVGSILGVAIPAAIVTVTIIVMKWGIRSFCECSSDN